MKINFVEDKNVRKLLYVYQLFGPPGSLSRGMMSYPMFFGAEFRTAAKIYSEFLYDRKSLKDSFSMLLSLTDQDRKKHILGELNKLDLGISDNNDQILKNLNKEIVDTLNTHEKEMKKWVNKIFGFNLPDKFILISDINPYTRSSSGTCICEFGDIPILGYLYGGIDVDGKCAADVILHELLHALMRQNKKVDKTTSNEYEEALLDYFSPSGILSKKIGLIKAYDIEQDHERKIRARPHVTDSSETLYNLIKKYYYMLDTQQEETIITIWEFLEQNHILLR